ncbi:hypothetical protein N7462_002982 [Penicillium macrosclerotiorum]|uniref:uncharacterized protein n=1 Tax=Penicillium macrosclerotiorum TaxID=303699 RepID=UPI002546BB2A|nr:uncharacterized protein N7462_002982 [Penicillium macrosclerotiorum]KAJ5688590.1 hypothetical protein N7462_002982 [Penicillium macrosclerotiorum]
MTSDIYDSDDAMNRSPPPVALQPKYVSDEPKPPFVSHSDDDAAKDTKGTPGRSRKPHMPETMTQTGHGDSVLMSFLDPGRPDIAAHARDHPYTEWAPKQDRVERAQPVNWKQPPTLPPLSSFEKGREYDASAGGRTAGMGIRIGAGVGEGADGREKKVEIDKSISHDEIKLKPIVEKKEGPFVSDDRKCGDPLTSPRNQIPPLPPPAPPSMDTMGVKRDLNSPPRQRPRLPSITAPPDRRFSQDRRLSPPSFKPDPAKPLPDHPFALPSLQSLASPPSSCPGMSPESAGSNQTLPSIHSALGGLSPNDFPSARLNGLPPPYSFSGPGSATSTDSPHDRSLPRSYLPSQIPPSPFSHFSPVSAKDASTHPSPASQPAIWRAGPPPHPPSLPASTPAETPQHVATPYETSPMTTKSPVTSYPTPTEQVALTPGPSDRAAFSSATPTNGAPTGTGNYKCTHPGCTAPPFQTQYLLK